MIFETEFIYTATHIETQEIPQLEELRNEFISNNPLYESRLDTDDPCFGINNDDPRWSDGTCESNILASPEPLVTTEADFE